jgi:hypothetical protein
MNCDIEIGDLVEFKGTSCRGIVIGISYTKEKGKRYKVKAGNLHTYGEDWIYTVYADRIERVLPETLEVSTIHQSLKTIKQTTMNKNLKAGLITVLFFAAVALLVFIAETYPKQTIVTVGALALVMTVVVVFSFAKTIIK